MLPGCSGDENPTMRCGGHGHIPIETPDMAIKVLKPVVVAKIVAKEAVSKSPCCCNYRSGKDRCEGSGEALSIEQAR
jgi:hypothetical protein